MSEITFELPDNKKALVIVDKLMQKEIPFEVCKRNLLVREKDRKQVENAYTEADVVISEQTNKQRYTKLATAEIRALTAELEERASALLGFFETHNIKPDKNITSIAEKSAEILKLLK